MSKKAVILFSGGLDSTTCLAIAKSEGYDVYALGFNYGQKHQCEVDFAKRITKTFELVEHKILHLPIDQIGGSSLTDPTLAVPDYVGKGEIPNTYVPARNTIFLSFALGYAEVKGATNIFIGANYLDYSGYPDCRPDYLRSFENLAELATKQGVEGTRYTIHAPLLYMKKSEIIKKGVELGVDYSMTLSCYRPDNRGRACGSCDSCTYRKMGFVEAGVADPTVYVV